LNIRRLNAYGYGVNDVQINVRNEEGNVALQLTAGDVNGELHWYPEGRGKLVARLQNLTLKERKRARARIAAQAAAHIQNNSDADFDEDSETERATATALPALDLVVDNLVWKGLAFGKVEMRAEPEPDGGWKLHNLSMRNPDGTLTVEGTYNADEFSPRTDVSIKLEFPNAGKALARFGYPDTVKNGSGTLVGGLWWAGALDEFSYAGLNGWFNLNMGKGQFLKVDPGIGRLIGILSLQALPSRIALDFTDVFSDGLAFDNITGTVQMKQGVMETNDFLIGGVSAKVAMQGQVDLQHETQNLHVRVMPVMGSSVSLLSAFAAGPIIGGGIFLASKILNDPLDKLVSFEYDITGTWTDPTVTKKGR
jgi:uncharacterized protein YhdP